MSISYGNQAEGETQEFSTDFAINTKVKEAVESLQPYIQKMVARLPTEEDKELISDFLLTCMKQENIAVKSKRQYVISLYYLSKYCCLKRPFKALSDKDIAQYLDSLKPSEEKVKEKLKKNPDYNLYGWINNRNTVAANISKFYRFVYFPDKSPRERRRLSKEDLAKIPQLKRFHYISTTDIPKSPIKSRHKWDNEDFATCLKYIENSNPRLACYVACARDMSARADEILRLRLSDIDKLVELADTGDEYTRLQVGRYSKKKKPRKVMLVYGLKHYRVWRQRHPQAENPNSFVFISTERSAKYKNIPVSVDSIRAELKKLKEQYFPTLLKRADIPQEDKKKIEKLLGRKFTPHVLRHSSLQLYRNAGASGEDLRKHAGWAPNSKMIQVYIDEEGDESCDNILQLAYNIDTKAKQKSKESEKELQGRQCPHCNVWNLNSAQTCISCNKMIDPIKLGLIVEKAERQDKELEEMKARQEKLEQVIRLMKYNTYQDELKILDYYLKRYEPEKYANLMEDEKFKKTYEEMKESIPKIIEEFLMHRKNKNNNNKITND
jgi:integrase